MNDIAATKAMNRVVSAHTRALRESLGETQAAFARRVGIPKATLVNVENGRQGLTLKHAYYLAAGLNKPISRVLPSADDVRHAWRRAQTCTWRPWRMGEGAPAQWRTSCGTTLGVSTIHSPSDLGFKACPFCAHPINVEEEESG